jgi:hypothetical protein
MKKILLLLFLSVGCQYLSVNAADKKPYPGGKYSIYRLTLKDKKGTTYSLAHPEAFLSAKAKDDATNSVSRRFYRLAVPSPVILSVSRGESDHRPKQRNNTVCRKAALNSTQAPHGIPFVVKATKVFTTPHLFHLTPTAWKKIPCHHEAPRTSRYGKGRNR